MQENFTQKSHYFVDSEELLVNKLKLTSSICPFTIQNLLSCVCRCCVNSIGLWNERQFTMDRSK